DVVAHCRKEPQCFRFAGVDDCQRRRLDAMLVPRAEIVEQTLLRHGIAHGSIVFPLTPPWVRIVGAQLFASKRCGAPALHEESSTLRCNRPSHSQPGAGWIG